MGYLAIMAALIYRRHYWAAAAFTFLTYRYLGI